MYTPADRLLDELLARTTGAFTRRTACRLGFSEWMIDRRLANGRWRRLHPGVYCLASTPMSDALRYSAAVLAAPSAVLSGLVAAHVHRFDRCRAAKAEITVPRSGNARVEGITVRRRAIDRSTVVRGLRVTTVPQTMLDIVPRLSFDRLDSVFDEIFVHRPPSRSDLDEMVSKSRLFRSPGGGLFRGLIRERIETVHLAESVLEARLLRLLGRSAVLGPVQPQARYPWWKEGRGRFDVAIPQGTTIVEVDGRSWHLRQRSFDEDRWRDATAAANGYQVLRFTALHVEHRASEVLQLIERTVAHRCQRAA